MGKAFGFPVRKDIECYRGDTWERAFRFIGRDFGTGEAYLLDTAGFNARFQVRKTVDDPVVQASVNGIVGISGTGPNQRNLTVRISDVVTANFPHGARWRYDLELTDPSGRRTTMMYGEFNVQGDVAK